MQKSNPFSFSEVYDDHFTMDDVATLHRAARLMRISAGQFINIAYIQNFREKPSDRKLRGLNNAFVFKDEVPLWAKEFALEIFEQHQKEEYDPWRYGLHPLKEPPYRFRLNGLYGLIPFVVTLLLFLAFAD